LSQHRYDMVILGDEPAVVTVGQYVTEHPEDAAWIDEWFPVAREMHELIFCKAAFTEACQDAGVPTPRSRVCHSFEELTAAADEVGYPLAVKTSLGFGGNGVIRVNDPRELHNAYEKLRHRAPLVAQEFVAGRIGTTQMVLDRGKVLYWMPTFVTKCCPEPYGPSCVRVFLDENDLAQMKPIVENVAKMTNFRGMCGIDWIQRKDGTFAILELNPRPTPAMELGRFAGVDCGEAVLALLNGKPVQLSPERVSGRNKTVYLFPQHVTRCLRYHKYRDLIYWLPFAATHDIPWNEPTIMASNIWRLMKLGTRLTLKNVTPWARYERPAILPEIVEPDEAAIGV
jgi:biotin carboxylase